MSKTPEIILRLLEPSNEKIFKASRVLRILGILILLLTVFLMEIGMIRIVLVSISLFLMSLPFVLNFFIDEFKQIGLMKLLKHEITVKFKGENPTIIKSTELEDFKFDITDFEGETKAVDLINSAGRMNMRLGTKNKVSIKTKKEDYSFNFKLNNGSQKKKVVNFFKIYQAQILLNKI